jgi:hypothetical protein
MTESTNSLKEMQSIIPTMDSFLDKFPILKNYIYNCDSTGKQITRLNILIVNIRHIIGWNNFNNVYESYIVDLAYNDNMYEITKFKDCKPVLKLLLKCIVEILWIIIEDVLKSPMLLEDEPNTINIGSVKKNIYSLASA